MSHKNENITPATVARIAHLARIGVTENDLSDYAVSLGQIMIFIEQINSVDTDTISPLAHPLEETQRLRADAVTEGNCRDLYQEAAPKVEQGLYLVPKVLD